LSCPLTIISLAGKTKLKTEKQKIPVRKRKKEIEKREIFFIIIRSIKIITSFKEILKVSGAIEKFLILL